KPNTAYRQYKKSLGIYQKSDARIDSRPKRTARRRIVNGCKLRQNHQGIGRKRNHRGTQAAGPPLGLRAGPTSASPSGRRRNSKPQYTPHPAAVAASPNIRRLADNRQHLTAACHTKNPGTALVRAEYGSRPPSDNLHPPKANENDTHAGTPWQTPKAEIWSGQAANCVFPSTAYHRG